MYILATVNFKENFDFILMINVSKSIKIASDSTFFTAKIIQVEKDQLNYSNAVNVSAVAILSVQNKNESFLSSIWFCFLYVFCHGLKIFQIWTDLLSC